MCFSLRVKIKTQKDYDDLIQGILLYHIQQKRFVNHLILQINPAYELFMFSHNLHSHFWHLQSPSKSNLSVFSSLNHQMKHRIPSDSQIQTYYLNRSSPSNSSSSLNVDSFLPTHLILTVPRRPSRSQNS